MNQSAHLTVNEQTTLRRVAHGLVEGDFMRMRDLEKLRALRLIDGNKRVPRLTPDGKRRYDALPQAAATLKGQPERGWLARLSGRLERRPRR